MGGRLVAPARYEPLSVLAAVAAVTQRAELGNAALMPAFRQPLGAAASLASFDALSGGRLIVAVGAGFPGLSEDELALVGVPYRRRFRWLDDVVSLWRRVWSSEPAPAFPADVLQLGWLPDVPRPYRAGGPPVWLAGATPAVLARAGRRHDGWIPYSTRLDYAAGLVALRSAASYAGRDADDVTPAMYLTVLVDDDAERGHRAAEEWRLRWYELPFEMVLSVQAFVIGSAAGVAARIARYVEAGAATSSSVWRRSTLRRTWLWSPTWCCAPNSPVEPARWWIRARRPRRRIGRHRRPRRTAGATDDLTGNEGLARSRSNGYPLDNR